MRHDDEWADRFAEGNVTEIITGRELYTPHIGCPQCAGMNVQRTGFFDGETETVKARCTDCDWQGMVEDLIEGESD